MNMIPDSVYFCVFISFFKLNCHINILLYSIRSLKLNVTIIIDCSSKIISNLLQDMESSWKRERYVINNNCYELFTWTFPFLHQHYQMQSKNKICDIIISCYSNILTYKSYKFFIVVMRASMSRSLDMFTASSLLLQSVSSNITSSNSIADIWTFVSSLDCNKQKIINNLYNHFCISFLYLHCVISS